MASDRGLPGLEIAPSQRRAWLIQRNTFLDGMPRVLVVDGRPLPERLAKARVTEDEILAAAQKQMGLSAWSRISSRSWSGAGASPSFRAVGRNDGSVHPISRAPSSRAAGDEVFSDVATRGPIVSHHWLLPVILIIVAGAGIVIVGVRKGWWVAIIFRLRK